jgi:hypothetical protein
MGNPGTRKSTAALLVKKLLTSLGFVSFSASKTRKEKFLLDLEGIPEESKDRRDHNIVFENLFGTETENDTIGQEPKEVFIIAPEFNNFLPAGDLEFLSDLGDLWDWDDENHFYRYRLKNSKSVHIFQPTISILAGNTHEGFQFMFPPQALGQGILSRIILVYAEPTGKKITFPPPPDQKIHEEILRTFRRIKEEVKGTVVIKNDARHALDMIYRSWKELDDQRFKHYSTRRFTHLLKLVIICAAARISRVVELTDVLLANTLLSFTENQMPKALGEFGKSRNAEAANKLMAALYETKKPMTLNDLWKVVSNDLDKLGDLSILLQNLQNADKIQIVRNEGFLPKQKPLDRKLLYLDFNLLEEYKQ